MFFQDKTELLGSGAFGSVFKGKVKGASNPVAVKVSRANCSANILKSLLSEIKILIYVGKHANVISIIGACTKDIGKGKEENTH